MVTLKDWLMTKSTEDGKVMFPVVALTEEGYEIMGYVKMDYILSTLNDLINEELPLNDTQFIELKSRFTPIHQRSWERLKTELTQ